MSDTEFKIGANDYRAGRLSARQQFDVARRLSFVLTMLGAEKTAEFKATPENFARIILVTAGQVPQADMDAALTLCLSTVKRKIPGDIGWAPLTAPGGALMMDIDMPELLEIVWRVVSAHRMVDFLSGNDQTSARPKTLA
jgi:hypothetical protein